MGRFTGKSCRMSTMFLLTFAFFLLEVIFGYLTNSMALIADSFHMLSDVLALVIAFACMKISKRRYSSRNTFGWVRAEVLGALINTVFLVALSFSIVMESIQRFFKPEKIDDPQKVLIVGALGLGVNIIGLFLFHGHGGHGHSHGGMGGGHGHSHGGGSKAKDHGHSHGGSEGHGHSHESGGHGHSHEAKSAIADGHGHSHNGVDKPKSLVLPNGVQQRRSRHSEDCPHQYDANGDEVFDENGSHVVREPEPVLDRNMVEAVRRVRRQSSKYSIRGEDLVHNTKSTDSPIDAQSPEIVEEEAIGKKSKIKKKVGGATQLNMHGIWLHVLGDAFGSIVVIVNAVVNMEVTNWFLNHYLDPMLSLLMSMLIIGTSIPLLKESAMILLQTVPTHINVQEIKNKLLDQFGHTIADVHDFHVWRLSGNKIVATAHIRCSGDMDDYMRLAEKMKEFFHDEGIHSTTIQPELIRGGGQGDWKHCALKCPKKTSGERLCADEACCIVPPTPALEVITTNPFFPAISSSSSISSIPAARTPGGYNRSPSTRFSFSGNPPTIVEEEDHQDSHI